MPKKIYKVTKMKFIKIINQFWFVPFLSFMLGYFFVSTFYYQRSIVVPNIIGKNLQDSFGLLTDKKLSLYLLKELENPDLNEGIVLSQSPTGGSVIKKNQKVFVVISKRPKNLNTPDFFEQKQSFINNYFQDLGLTPQLYWLESFYPINTCIAQSQLPSSSLDIDNLILYLSAGKNNFFVIPDLTGCRVDELNNYIDFEKIYLDAFYNNQTYPLNDLKDKNIIDQKPMSGSIVDLSKTLYLQIQVQ